MLVRLCAASAVALLAAAPALAQVTAQQVWDDYKQSFGLGGPNVSVGSEAQNGNVLTVGDVAVNATDANGGTIAVAMPELVFTENGDGTVTVTMPAEVPITVTTPADAAAGTPASEVRLALRQTGMAMVASGAPGAISYDVSADTYAMELVSATQDGQPVPATASLTVNALSGTYNTSGTDPALRDVAWDMTADSVDLAVDVTDSTDGTRVNVSGTISGLSSQATMAMPVGGDPNAALQDGLAIDAGYAYTGAQYAFDVGDSTGTASGTANVGQGSLDFALARDSISYSSNVSTVALDVTSAQLPFPVNAQIAQYGLDVQVPLGRTDAPAPWTLGVNLSDLALNEEVWQIFDPQAMLPRDPATVRLALSGTATLFQDLTDPAAEQAMTESGAAPGQVDSVSIDDLELSIAGASVTGSGSFTLDNTDLTTFQGIPRPEGTAQFQMTGVNGLIDTLGTMGLLPQDQLMGARMMLGMFATPVEGQEDQLSSTVEVNAQGQLLVNGQRLQ